MSIACIANNGADGSIEVPFYDCPCAVCTKMEWDIREEESITLREHRHTMFPEHWDAQGKVIAQHPFDVDPGTPLGDLYDAYDEYAAVKEGVIAQLRREPNVAEHARKVAELLRLVIAQPRKFNRDETASILSDAAWLLDLHVKGD
jgi:hypothetical protein